MDGSFFTESKTYLPFFAISRDASKFRPTGASCLKIQRLLLRFNDKVDVAVVDELQLLQNEGAPPGELSLASLVIRVILRVFKHLRCGIITAEGAHARIG